MKHRKSSKDNTDMTALKYENNALKKQLDEKLSKEKESKRNWILGIYAILMCILIFNSENIYYFFGFLCFGIFSSVFLNDYLKKKDGLND